MVDGSSEEGGKVGKNGDEKEGVGGWVDLKGGHEGHHGVSVQVRGGEEDPKYTVDTAVQESKVKAILADIKEYKLVNIIMAVMRKEERLARNILTRSNRCSSGLEVLSVPKFNEWTIYNRLR